MSTVVVVVIVIVGAALLFGLAWWSSGRSKGLGQRSRAGAGADGYEGVQANTRHSSMGTDISGSGPM
jgi:hypothetical protein